ncbi:MAG: metallophosphoesterase [Verrucomicrobiia bacterium]
MKLLLTSDLHRDGKKLLWLLDEAPAHDALLVAGDLLDIFSRTDFPEQKTGALRWRDAIMKSGKSLAWCSGNHDFYRGEDSDMKAASPLWMKETSSHKHYVTDGESRILETAAGPIAVTTIPWPVTGDTVLLDGYRTNYLDFVKNLLRSGRKLKEEEKVPWIILNHEPPLETPLATNYSSPEADFSRRLIEAAGADFSLHGHIHHAPTATDDSWIHQLGPTTCFNAGQSAPGEPLHYILLELHNPGGDWTAIWHGGGGTLRQQGQQGCP